MNKNDEAIKRLKSLTKQKPFRLIFEYLRSRKLLSSRTDIYSVKISGASSTQIREFFEALASQGIGSFKNRRSFDWGDFDLRVVAQLALAPGGELVKISELYRSEYRKEIQIKELEMIKKSSDSYNEREPNSSIRNYLDIELKDELERRGYIVVLTRKSPSSDKIKDK